jgi:hypothetical protein
MNINKKYPFPIIYDLFDQLRGDTIFSNIDLRSRYEQAKIKDEYIDKKNFITRYGNYEYVVVKFGFTHSPTTFMCFMNSVLNNYLDKFFLVFVNEFWCIPRIKRSMKNILEWCCYY